jgi:hypothetical protein
MQIHQHIKQIGVSPETKKIGVSPETKKLLDEYQPESKEDKKVIEIIRDEIIENEHIDLYPAKGHKNDVIVQEDNYGEKKVIKKDFDNIEENLKNDTIIKKTLIILL